MILQGIRKTCLLVFGLQSKRLLRPLSLKNLLRHSWWECSQQKRKGVDPLNNYKQIQLIVNIQQQNWSQSHIQHNKNQDCIPNQTGHSILVRQVRFLDLQIQTFSYSFFSFEKKSIGILPLMSEGNSQIDVTELDFETDYQPFNDVKYQFDPEVQSKAQKSCISQMKRLYERLLTNAKRIVAKLCYALGKFSPFEPIIKQSFEDIQRLKEQWFQFNNQNKDKYSFWQFSQVEQLKRQQIDTKQLRDSQMIKTVPLIKNQIPLKTSFLQENPFPIFSSLKPEREESNQSLQLNSQKNPNLTNNSQYRFNLKDQFYHIKQFVFFQLHPKLVLQYDKILYKKVVLNCYILWNRKINRQLKITQMAKLQMELTVQIKQKFPNLETKRKFFKGIGFKEQFINEMNLTDRKPIIREQDINFDTECQIHPIDQIIKLARSSQKNEIQKPYSQEQLRALDEALGLI